MSCTPPTVSGPKFGKILQLRYFFGRTSLTNRNIDLAILLLAGDVHPNPGPINRETIYPCGYCQQHVGWSCSGVGCETCNVWYHRECVSITHSHYLAPNNLAHVWICFKCQTPNFSNSSILIIGSPEINFNSPNSLAVLSDLTCKDDVSSFIYNMEMYISIPYKRIFILQMHVA